MGSSHSLAREKFYPVVLCFFVGSGFAALIYEIVWFQLLELVIGSTAASLAVLLGTFMGGMCLGSLAFARIIPASFHPLKAYAAIEFGIGLIAILVLYLLPPAADLYASIGAQGSVGILLRAILCAAFLLAPTVLMGATLPCAARFIERTPRGVSWLGILYTGNLAGGVAGCLVAGFYLLRLYDMPTATFAAVAINVLCAALALIVAAATPYQAAGAAASPERLRGLSESIAVYLAIALSGLTALGAQVVWTRLLSLLLGPSVYTFSIILAVFLLGLGLGSSAGSLLSRGPRNPLAMLGWCQFLLVGAILWAAFSIDAWLPYWPVFPVPDPLITFQLDLARALWAVLPAACLWGASFPLALAAAAPRHEDSGRVVGAVYAANTVGAIVGAVAFSIVLIPAVGTQGAQRVLLAVAGVAASLVLLARLPALIKSGARLRPVAAVAAIVAVALVTGAVAAIVPPIPPALYAFGRKVMNPDFAAKMLYVGEGLNASIAVSEDENGARYFHVSGKVEAGSYPSDMRLQRMLGHLPALIAAKPQSVLVVGFGAGVTAGTFVTYPRIERIVICEIEPLIPRKVADYFVEENYGVLKDPRVTLVYDDARRFVLTANERFDIITSDPIHPWVRGAATLYTREYFELVKRHLNPGGVVTQWVPLYESNIDVVKSEMATFFSVFPQGIVWVNDREDGADVVLLGRADPAPIDVDAIVRRFDGNPRAAASLRDIGFDAAIDLLSSYAGRAPDLAGWLNGAAVNTDRDLRLQYLAGLSLNFRDQHRIHAELIAARRVPDGLFVGSEATLAELRNAIENAEPGSYTGNPGEQQER